MGSYKLVIKQSAERELRAVPQRDLRRIVNRVQGLAQNPRPPGNEKLSGQERYRVRQGDYRMVHSVDDEGRTVEVAKIEYRREAYRS
jgi:mRNA interferase RelE/StbE